jgi:hypothetical protein
MKYVKFCLLGITAIFSSALVVAQTAEEIVSKHIEAIGGKDKISTVKSVYTEGSLSIMGNEAPSKSYLLNGKGYRSELDFNGQQIVQVFTDKGGWAINPMGGGTDPVPMPDDQYKNGKGQLNAGGPLYDYQAKGSKVELQGKEGELFKLKLTTDGTEQVLLIDPSTYYITKQITKGEVQGQQVDITSSFSNYKKTDYGLVLPYTTEIDLGGFTISATVTKVEVNKEIDPKIFEMPAK